MLIAAVVSAALFPRWSDSRGRASRLQAELTLRLEAHDATDEPLDADAAAVSALSLGNGRRGKVAIPARASRGRGVSRMQALARAALEAALVDPNRRADANEANDADDDASTRVQDIDVLILRRASSAALSSAKSTPSASLRPAPSSS